MMKDFLTLAFIVLLFAALTPGLYFTFPRNGPKFVVALCHGIAFALILYFTHSIVRGLFRKVTEGFRKGKGAVPVTPEQRIEAATSMVTSAADAVAAAEAAGDQAALADAQGQLLRASSMLDAANAKAALATAAAANDENAYATAKTALVNNRNSARASRRAGSFGPKPVKRGNDAKLAARAAAAAAAAEAAAAEAAAAEAAAAVTEAPVAY